MIWVMRAFCTPSAHRRQIGHAFRTGARAECWLCPDAEQNSGRVPVMTPGACRKSVLLCLCVSITAGLNDQRLHAVGSTPAFRVGANTDMTRAVWPADFNGDGITDLASTASDGVVQASLGRGDGTFFPPIRSAARGRVLATGDFNKDGRRDLVIAADASSETSVSLLAGAGNGSFAAPRAVVSLNNVSFALTGDMDGNGTRDLLLATEPDQLRVFPGNGDLSFGTPIQLTTGTFPHGGIVADLNGDGRPDVVVANRYYPFSLSIFLNQGGLLFTSSDVPLDRAATDVTAADLNGDGATDLAVSVMKESAEQFTEGYAYVLRGRGDGTFDPPASYPTANGAYQIVVGDFTRDGILDIATANRSYGYRDDCGPGFKGWDTLSVLPGIGNGAFGTASTFSLSDQRDPLDMRFTNSVTSLNTSDLNGDHETDLIASFGAIFLNVPFTANRAPTVSAGQNAVLPNYEGEDILLAASAFDPDGDMLTYHWTTPRGEPIAPAPDACAYSLQLGDNTFTVTVDDGHGHTASSSVTYTVTSFTPGTVEITAPATGETLTAGAAYTIAWTTDGDVTPVTGWNLSFSSDGGATWQPINECTGLAAENRTCTWRNPGPATTAARVRIHNNDADGIVYTDSTQNFTIAGEASVPYPWYSEDVGAVGSPGTASFANGTFTVSGSGADIWGTSDAFQYAYTALTGDGSIVARVATVQNVNNWTKAGVMIRNSVSASAAQAYQLVAFSPAKGVPFQRRTSDGDISVSTSGSQSTAPRWVKLVRSGNTITGYESADGTTWTLVGSDTIPMANTVYVGLAVSSHTTTTTATATFDNVSVP